MNWKRFSDEMPPPCEVNEVQWLVTYSEESGYRLSKRKGDTVKIGEYDYFLDDEEDIAGVWWCLLTNPETGQPAMGGGRRIDWQVPEGTTP